MVLLITFGAYRGHTGVRQLARRMNGLLRDATFDYHELEVDGEIGFLRWSAHGADGVRDGRIVARTIHYGAEQDGHDSASPAR